MKYKQCPVCGLYNKYTKIDCSCGFDLSNVSDIVELDQETVNELNSHPIIPQNKASSSNEIKTSEIQCPSCSNMNDADALFCEECGYPLVESLAEKDIESDSLSAEKKKKTNDPELRFKVIYNSKTYEFTATSSPVFFGRESIDDDMFCKDLYISRKHFSYRYGDNSIVIVDCSTNGTSLNGVRIKLGKPTKIKSGDVIALYDREIKIIYAS